MSSTLHRCYKSGLWNGWQLKKQLISIICRLCTFCKISNRIYQPRLSYPVFSKFSKLHFKQHQFLTHKFHAISIVSIDNFLPLTSPQRTYYRAHRYSWWLCFNGFIVFQEKCIKIFINRAQYQYLISSRGNLRLGLVSLIGHQEFLFTFDCVSV